MVEEHIAAGFSMQHLSSSGTSHVKDLILKTKPSLFIANIGYSSQTRTSQQFLNKGNIQASGSRPSVTAVLLGC